MSTQELEEIQKPKSNFKEIGRSGTFVTSFEIQDDYISELNGTTAQNLYHKMLLSDSQIRKVYHAVSNPIKSAEWDIQPASEEEQDIEAAALIKQILFCDLPGGFVAKLDEVLTFPWQGHSVFEVIHKNRNNPEFGAYTGLANLAFRDQRTLEEWHFNKEGHLEKIKQRQEGDIKVETFIPVENLLIFYNEKKGNDSGYPFCRMLYGNYKRKLLYKELQAIGIERAALPTPHLKLPVDVDTDSPEYQSAVDQLAAFTQAEQAYFITPDGYELEYNQTGTYDPQKVQAAIKAENEEIAGSVVAMWLEMGIGGNSAVGSSTGESLKFFISGIEYIADKIAELINLELIPNLMALNYGPAITKYPTLTHSGISEEASKELMEIVTGYAAQGIINIDESLEDHIRKIHNLPKKAEGEMLENQETQDSPTTEEPKEEVIPEEVELNTKEAKTPKTLINQQAVTIAESLREVLNTSAKKYIHDTMVRYRQLPENKKQNATNTVVMSGSNKLKKALKRDLTATSFKSIDMAKKEIPSKKDVQLSFKNERELVRLTEKYGDISNIKLNEVSKLPAHIQVLIAKQSDLLTAASMDELESRIGFAYSGIETKSADENVIQQRMEDEAADYIDSSRVNLKGTNAASLMVNESRESFFFDDDVIDEIHSFTFVNIAPKSAICRELAGTTFATNDAESLRYSPPLHHNCKSYLRANLKSSKGVDRLEVSTLSPSADAKKSITL